MQGFKIFPCGVTPEGKKIPLIKDWETQASADPAQHQQWLEFFRDRIKGWGLPAGANGLYILDIDTKPGGVNGFQSLTEMGIVLPDTAYQRTPSGGLHLFFQTNEYSGRNTVNKELGLDTRGEHGFVWLYNPDFSRPILPTPHWIADAVSKRKKPLPETHQSTNLQLHPELSMQRFNDAIAAIRNAPEGERNHTLNTQAYVIGQLVRGGAVSAVYAEQAIHEAAASIGLTPSEIQATTRSGLKGGAANPLSHPFGDAPPVPALSIVAPAPELPKLDARWTPRCATRQDLTNWHYLRKPQLFEDWSSQDPILTSAIGGVGKTTMKLYEAACLALGEPFLGFKCLKPGKTLFVIGEDSEEKLYAMLGRTCKQMGLFEPGQESRLQTVIDSIRVKFADDICLVVANKHTGSYSPNPDAIRKIMEAVEDIQPVQIIFDPIAMFWGPEAGGNDMAVALSKAILILVKQSGASVDSIAHIGKDSATKKDTGQFSARGATALANHSRIIRTLISMDDAEYLEKTGEPLGQNQSAIMCHVSKFSDGSPILGKPFIILRDGFIFSRKNVPDGRVESPAANDKQRIFDMIRTHSREDRPVTEQDVVDWAYTQQPRIAKSTTKSLIGLLKFEGVIEEVPHLDVTIGDWLRLKT